MFEDTKVEVFAGYMVALLAGPEFKASELKELAQLKDALGMSQVGAAALPHFRPGQVAARGPVSCCC